MRAVASARNGLKALGGCDEFVLRGNRQNFSRSRLRGSSEQTVNGAARLAQRHRGTAAAQAMKQEQRGNRVAGAVYAHRQQFRAQAMKQTALADDHVHRIWW